MCRLYSERAHVLYFVSILLSYLNIIVGTVDFKLSDSKLLLPYNSFLPINYTLSGSDGACYKWHSSVSEVATVTPIFDKDNSDCSNQATVSAVWQSPHKATTTVYAQNQVTGHLLKCDVIVDTIHHLEIETITQELYLHDAPEALVARGFDEFGNTFSSLEGLPFDWRIHTVERANKNVPISEGHSVLRFITWTESEYTTPKNIGELEAKGLQGYMQLISGFKTGSAKVTLSIKESIYRNVIGGEVKLIVMANAVLNPALAYVIPHAEVKYRVSVVSQGSIHEVAMPSKQYHLKVNNTELATLDASTSTVTAKQYGETEIILYDSNVEDSFRQPTSLLHIVEAGYLSFSVSPGKLWVLQVGSTYEVVIDVLDHNNHRIYPSDNLRIVATFPDNLPSIISTVNGTHHIVQPNKKGSVIIEAVLSDVILQDGSIMKLDTPVYGSQEVEIYDPIEVIPPLVVLPWDPRVFESAHGSVVSPSYPLRAKGGSGEYSWSVSSQINSTQSIVVSVKGVVIPKAPGSSVVNAADVRNLHNFGSARVDVVTPASMEFPPSKVEVEISPSHTLDLPLVMYDAEDRPMSDCHYLPIKIEVADQSVVVVEYGNKISSTWNSGETCSKACMKIRIRGLKVGFTDLIASYTLQDDTDNLVLTAKVTVAAYLPAKFQDPEKLALVAIGSVRSFRLTGGPRPWILDPSGYFCISSNPDSPAANNIEILSTNQGVRFEIKCQTLGEYSVIFSVGNSPTAKNPYPAVSKATVKLVCTIPVRLRLVPQLNLPRSLPPCPIANDTDNQQVPLLNKESSRVNLIFTDREGREFDKVESLNVHVNLQDPVSAQSSELVSNPKPVIQYDSDCSICIPWFLVSPKILSETIGPLQVLALSNSYSEDVSGPPFSLTAKVDLRLSEPLVLEPDELFIYDHPKASHTFHIGHGSGFFLAIPDDNIKIKPLSTSDTVTVSQSDQSTSQLEEDSLNDARDYQVGPLKEGLSRLPIYDLCFDQETPSFVNVKVVGLSSLQLVIVDKLQIGHETTGLLYALDSDDQFIPAKYLSLMQLKVISESDILRVTSDISLISERDWDIPAESREGALRFTVRGANLGVTRLYVQGVRRDGAIVESNMRDLQVFPPLKLEPRHVTLIVGSRIHLDVTGGPHPCNIEFTLMSDGSRKQQHSGELSKVELINQSGLVAGLAVGAPRPVRAMAVGPDPLTGNSKAIYSQDDGFIQVVLLESIRIVSPVPTLTTGNKAPLWVAGMIEGLNPLALADVRPEFTFDWSLKPPQPAVAKLEHYLEPYGVKPEKKHLSSGLRIVALNPGKVTVHLLLRAKNPSAGQIKSSVDGSTSELEASLVLDILEPLNLIHPPRSIQSILMTPSSQLKILPNLGSQSDVTFRIVNGNNQIGVSVTDTGLLKAPAYLPVSSDPAVLIVQSVDKSDPNRPVNQSFAIQVVIKPVSFIMISSDPGALQLNRAARKLNGLSSGGPYRFKESFHDNLGMKFDAVTNALDLHFRHSRKDRIELSLAQSSRGSDYQHSQKSFVNKSASNSDHTSLSEILLKLRLLNHERDRETVVHLKHDANERLREFISVPTGSSLISNSEVQEGYSVVQNGDRLCINPPYSGGEWSSNSPIIHFTPGGAACAVGVGSAHVIYTLPQNSHSNLPLVLTENININPLTGLSLRLGSSMKPVPGKLLSPELKNSLLFYVETDRARRSSKSSTLQNDSCSHPSSDDIDWNFPRDVGSPLSCRAELDSVSLAKMSAHMDSQILEHLVVTEFGMEVKTGLYVCRVSLRQLSKEDNIKLSTFTPEDAQIQISGHVEGSSNQAPLSSDNIASYLVPGFHLFIPGQSSLTLNHPGDVLDFQLVLSPAVQALCNTNKQACLDVRSSKPNVLQVLPKLVDDERPGFITLPVQTMHLDKSVIQEVEVIFRLPIVQQEESVTITLDMISKPSDNTNPSRNWINFPYAFAIVSLLVAIFGSILIYLITSRPNNVPSSPYPIFQNGMNTPYNNVPVSPNRRNQLWSHGYSFAEPGSDFHPVSPDRRSPGSPMGSIRSLNPKG